MDVEKSSSFEQVDFVFILYGENLQTIVTLPSKIWGIEDCSVAENSAVGSLVGVSEGGTISNCYATGEVTGVNYIGGLVGRMEYVICYSYSTATVSGKAYVGGLVGRSVNGIESYYA